MQVPKVQGYINRSFTKILMPLLAVSSLQRLRGASASSNLPSLAKSCKSARAAGLIRLTVLFRRLIVKVKIAR